jgi:hypothetical protein
MLNQVRPGKLYSVAELARILQFSQMELLSFVNKHKIKYHFENDQMVFLGSDIHELIKKLSCTPPDSP